MNDTAVSTSLVLRNILPFFQDENPCFGILFADIAVANPTIPPPMIT